MRVLRSGEYDGLARDACVFGISMQHMCVTVSLRANCRRQLGEGCIPRAADGLLGVAAPYVFARDSIGQSIPVLPQEAFPETEFALL